MKKLALHLEDLSVESFATAARSAQGPVIGAAGTIVCTNDTCRHVCVPDSSTC